MTPEEKKANEEEISQVLFRDPKKFVNSTRIYIAKNFFALRLNIGDQPETFALPPEVAKMLSHFLSLQVAAYEHGVAPIHVELGLPSPIQQADLKKPDSGESGIPGSEPPNPEAPPEKKPKK